MTRPLRTACLIGIVCLSAGALPPAAGATSGDKSFGLQLSYSAITPGGSDYLHTPSLSIGGAWHITDFALLELTGFYDGTYDESWRQFWGADLAFRLLLDATQWVPSVGPVVGWMFGYSSPDGLEKGLYAGLGACLEHRSRRSFSLGLCGTGALVPFHEAWEALYTVGFRVSAYLPYFFE